MQFIAFVCMTFRHVHILQENQLIVRLSWEQYSKEDGSNKTENPTKMWSFIFPLRTRGKCNITVIPFQKPDCFDIIR